MRSPQSDIGVAVERTGAVDAIPRTIAQEWISFSCVQAIIAQAGLCAAKVDWDDGIDLYIGSRKPLRAIPNGCGNQWLAVQLKSTTRWALSEDGQHILYRLKVDNYNKLCEPSHLPQILMVYLMPRDRHRWVTHGQDVTHLSHAAYYLSFERTPKRSARSTIQVSIPIENRLTAKHLLSLFRSAYSQRSRP